MWRRHVAGVVVTALVLMPGLATTCAAACLRPTRATVPGAAGAAAHAHHGATARAHHGSTPAQSGMRVRAEPGVAPVHDCRDHDGAVHWWRTASRADRQIASPSEPPHPFPPAVSAFVARHTPRSTHGPPGGSGVVVPLVLRI